MGDFTEHVLFGFLSAAITAYFLKEMLTMTVLQTFAASLGLIIGSVLPDIDHKNSYVHRAVKSFISIGIGLTVALIAPVEMSMKYVLGTVSFLATYSSFSLVKIRHRGFTHSFSFLAIAASTGVIVGVYTGLSVFLGLALGLGVFSHLLLDREFSLD